MSCHCLQNSTFNRHQNGHNNCLSSKPIDRERIERSDDCYHEIVKREGVSCKPALQTFVRVVQIYTVGMHVHTLQCQFFIGRNQPALLPQP